ncbi:MAG: right-handed parallel beta-helix repeat-containing protein [Clostridia bacterium]|nr:right-handed parallel beta-helix repeat-containing protein [Clostridia bacterium]
MIATKALLDRIDARAEERKRQIRAAKDSLQFCGKAYYVSADGSDENDGTAPECAWKTLRRVSETPLEAGDAVLFHRGDLFRGWLQTCAGVTYGAYGSGEKPRLYGWDYNLADEALWEAYDSEHHIWRLKNKILDCGTLVFNGGEAHCRKLIPSYLGSRFVCRDDESRVFELAREMTQDLDLVCLYDARLDTTPSKGEEFPIPLLDEESLGELYLRCDRGNPASVYEDIEALPRRHMICVGSNANVTVDNLCVKYVGCHGISAGGQVNGLHVSNCEFGWIGGVIQHYKGTDPNYPEGGRGTVTRYGNAIEIYGGCEDYAVSNCYIYQVYDAGITHQVTTQGKTFVMHGIRYLNNLIEHCVYGIEYFLEKNMGDTESYVDDCLIEGNIIRFSGYGWGQQRHNYHTPAHVKGWSYENTASNFRIVGNIFDRAAHRMLHLVAKKQESCPVMNGNTYIQHAGMMLGQYGANETAEPPILRFDGQIEETVRNTLGDRNACVLVIEKEK